MKKLAGLVVGLVLMLGALGCESEEMATPAVGGGVCCPIQETPCGRAGGWSAGGWAASEDGCGAHVLTTFDGRWSRGSEEHGCAVWVDRYWSGGPADVCCGCPRVADSGGDGDAGVQ